jgi:transcriptional regulator with XRE-family HTH domain
MYKIDYTALVERIRAERKRQGLTQEKLAELANISESFEGHIERGDRVLSIETLISLANALNISVEYVMFGSKNADNQPVALPPEVNKLINQMGGSQQRYFINMIKTLAENFKSWE